jgi:octaprenyl-diphosphate synthase
MNIGIAFQIKDDLLDLGFGANIGKPLGADIQENKITLPLIHALSNGSAEQKIKIKSLLKNKNISSADLKALQNILIDAGSIAFADAAMNEYANRAKEILNSLPGSDVNQAFQQLVDFTIQRNK